MGVFTEFGKLKEIIVGNVVNFNLEKLDRTFKVGYWENLKGEKHFDSVGSVLGYFDSIDYSIDEQKLQERREDMDNFANILRELGITVRRPEELISVKTFKTPDFFGVLTPVSNPRDRVFVYGKTIIETPAMIRKRYFENQLLYNLFQEYVLGKGYNWISAPAPALQYDRFDARPWNEKRDYINFNKQDYDIAFDAAQLLKIGKDILFNITSYNHENGAIWMQRTLDALGTGAKVHKLYQLDDNHIDGVLMVLKPGVFLVNNDYVKKPHLNDIKKFLPEKFHNWKYIYIEDNPEEGEMTGNGILDAKSTDFLQLCSIRGSFTNVLPIDENTICVNRDAVKTIAVLERHGFKVIPIQFRHCEIFGGGLHCATLDVDREDENIFY